MNSRFSGLDRRMQGSPFVKSSSGFILAEVSCSSCVVRQERTPELKSVKAAMISLPAVLQCGQSSV